MNDSQHIKTLIAHRFRGFLPVVIDVETGGFNARTDALLEIAAVILDMNEDGIIHSTQTHAYSIQPFAGSNIEPEALEFTGIQPHDPARFAVAENDALHELFRHVRKAVRDNGCTRAIMVAHNAHFDLGFLMAAAARCEIKRNPFHPFSVFDTATLSGLAYGQTVLAKTCQQAGIPFSNSEAHSAAYDAEKTADLFCTIVNRWKAMGGYVTDPDIPC